MIYILVLLTVFYDSSIPPVKDWYMYNDKSKCESDAKEMEQIANEHDASLMAMCLETM